MPVNCRQLSAQWKSDRDPRAPGRRAFDRDHSLMRLDKALGGCEPQSRAPRLGGKEGRENLVANLLWNPGPESVNAISHTPSIAAMVTSILPRPCIACALLRRRFWNTIFSISASIRVVEPSRRPLSGPP